MNVKSKPPPSRLNVDKHIPAKIWKQIFSYLYPSQLCRLSMVSKTFETIVGSLPVWYHLFTKNNYGKQLRFLRAIPESKSYMLYMCASSLHIWEECYRQEFFDSETLVDLPLLVLVRLPKRRCFSEEAIKYVGNEAN
ncbi:hypothetical protein BGZ92_007311 [Podila epicladia]|nr:hypothetical protein BGZ92_007311 [Podila epicladia]